MRAYRFYRIFFFFCIFFQYQPNPNIFLFNYLQRKKYDYNMILDKNKLNYIGKVRRGKMIFQLILFRQFLQKKA
jgi:hypothetical protein